MAKKTQSAKTFERESFVFYRSFFEAIEACPLECQRDIYRAITVYALFGETTHLTGVQAAIFALAKPQIDANTKRYLNGCKGKEHGIKGGGSMGNKNAAKISVEPPYSLTEVIEYFDGNQLKGDPKKFYYHYNSKGWKWHNKDIKTWQQMAKIWADYAD